MALDANEFMRRFLTHVLPKGFRRIRHFGFLANACSSRPSRPRNYWTKTQPAPGVLEAINGNVQAAKRKAKATRTKRNLKAVV